MITEIILGGFIHHFTITPKQIDRTSFQPNVILKSQEFNFLVGSNSIGKPILGAAYDIPFQISLNKKEKNINFKLGAYIQDNNEFEKIGVEVNVGDVVPIVALEYRQPLYKHWGLTTVISNFIAFGGVSYEF
jgi:hypothetical protein